MCQTVDRAAVNLRIGELTVFPSACYKTHGLQSEVNLTKKSAPSLKIVIDRSQENMREIRRNNKNIIVLRNLTHWRHIIPGNTRWRGDYGMIS